MKFFSKYKDFEIKVKGFFDDWEMPNDSHIIYKKYADFSYVFYIDKGFHHFTDYHWVDMTKHYNTTFCEEVIQKWNTRKYLKFLDKKQKKILWNELQKHLNKRAVSLVEKTYFLKKVPIHNNEKVININRIK